MRNFRGKTDSIWGAWDLGNRNREDQGWLKGRVNSGALIEAMNGTGRFVGKRPGRLDLNILGRCRVDAYGTCKLTIQ